MKILFSQLLILFATNLLIAQNNTKIIESKGEAVVKWNMNTESKDLAKSRALELAKDNSINPIHA